TSATAAPSVLDSWRIVQGRAFYEKILVSDNGLDLSHPVFAPIRNARVEVVDPTTNRVFTVSQTDSIGHFEVMAPRESNSTVRVLTRLRDSKVLVLDNTRGNSLYAATLDLGRNDSNPLLIARDANRISGAFNILEMLQQGSELLKL